MTARVQRALLERLAEDDYRASAKSLAVFGNRIAPATAGRLMAAVGQRLHLELFGPLVQPQPPDNPCRLLIVQGDGARYRTNLADVRKAAPRAEQQPRDAQDRGWRENKIGVVIRAQPGRYAQDQQYQAPQEIVKTYVATTEDIKVFERDLKLEAERRGCAGAVEVVWVSDHAHGLDGLREHQFPKVPAITDIFHVYERLGACARVIHGEGSATEKVRRKWYHRYQQKLYDGKTTQVLAELTPHAEQRAPRPEKPSALEEGTAARILWEHVFYIEKHQQTMCYDVYRRKGWPLSSSAVESACAQFGQRVKHGRMRWTPAHADALHQIKAAILSQDGRWERRWPPAIPQLDLAPAA
jgi:hypothetical protein